MDPKRAKRLIANRQACRHAREIIFTVLKQMVSLPVMCHLSELHLCGGFQAISR